MSHQQLRQYLEDYSSHFDLFKYIHFKTIVTRVKPLTSSDSAKVTWEVAVEHAETKETRVHVFDAVIVCNG